MHHTSSKIEYFLRWTFEKNRGNITINLKEFPSRKYKRVDNTLGYTRFFSRSIHELNITNETSDIAMGILRLETYYYLHKLLVCTFSLVLSSIFFAKFLFTLNTNFLLGPLVTCFLFLFYYFYERFDLVSHWNRKTVIAGI